VTCRLVTQISTLEALTDTTRFTEGFFRWMASPAIDRMGNIAIGYSFGGSPNFAGQRFAARLRLACGHFSSTRSPACICVLERMILAEAQCSPAVITAASPRIRGGAPLTGLSRYTVQTLPGAT
jgi:hypothetical protein